MFEKSILWLITLETSLLLLFDLWLWASLRLLVYFLEEDEDCIFWLEDELFVRVLLVFNLFD
jgi:hypothetical protein